MNSLSNEVYVSERMVSNNLFRKKGIVVIDDDEQFCALIQVVAKNMGAPVHCFESLYHLGSFACLREYDVAILDFHLDSINGIEIAEYVDTFFRDLPVLLVSGDENLPASQNKWPTSIKNFIGKSAGPFNIVKTACKIVERDRYLKQFQSQIE